MAASFLQVGQLSTKVASSEDLANFEALRMVRDIARKQHSHELAQLAARMASVTRSSSSDPFLKVKGLITDMIATLEAQAGQDATSPCWAMADRRCTRQARGGLLAHVPAVCQHCPC